MRTVTSFHLWYALTWLSCIFVYSWGWSELNGPLDPRLVAFLLITALTSLLVFILQGARTGVRIAELPPADLVPARGGWRLTSLFVIGFTADFLHRGGIPFFSGGYVGYDITTDVQVTIGIPVVHVVLVAGVIFFALERADRFFRQRSISFLVQFSVLLMLLLLNNSRGYMTFVLIGASLIYVARRFSDGRRVRLGVLFLVAVAGVLILFGIGVFGNIRSGAPWWDSSQITHLGRYQDRYPDWLSAQFQWAYTYYTSPLGNLNLNMSVPSHGPWYQVVLMFIPDSFGKGLVAGKVDAVYQVSYLNAPTGYVVPYFLGGGLLGMYVAYVLQVLFIELGGFLARRLGTAVVLYRVCSCVVVIVFVFFNSFSNVATCFLLPLALLLGFVRRRQHERRSATLKPGRQSTSTSARSVSR